MTLDGTIPKPVALLALLGTLCISISGACTTQPALAEASGVRASIEWDRDDEDDDTVAIKVRRTYRRTDRQNELTPAIGLFTRQR